MLTNMGMIWPEATREEQMGGSTITDISALNPVVAPMGQTITIHSNHGSLHVCLGYKTGLLSKEGAQRFLDMYLEEVRSLPSHVFQAPSSQSVSSGSEEDRLAERSAIPAPRRTAGEEVPLGAQHGDTRA
jgi:hypothetical protein